MIVPKRLNGGDVGNEAGVYFARRGYYNGQEVTVTHRFGSQVYLEDFAVTSKNSPPQYGLWVNNDSVQYKDDIIVEAQPPKRKSSKRRR